MLTSSDAAHLLRRVGFAGASAEVSHFTGMTREQAVDEILDASTSLPTEPGWIHVADWWTRLNDLRWWWAQRMIDGRWTNRTGATPSPLVEKLALFWHSHFATGIDKVSDLSAMFYQNQLFRQYGMGDFETLLAKVTYDDHLGAGSLLFYLDNDTNHKDNPQENFARELMELYTIGPDEFTELDVIEMARAWTGHGVVGWVGYQDCTHLYRPDWRDNSNKQLFGLSPRNWGAENTVTELAKGVKQDACARFLIQKLWRFFVNDDPSPAAVTDLVAVFTPSMNIKTLLRAMLLREEFWAPTSHFNLVRSPIEFIVDLCRRHGVAAADSNLQWIMSVMGQELFEPPSVAGWGTHGYWVSTMGSWGRSQFLSQFRWNEQVNGIYQTLMAEPDASTGAARIIDQLGLADTSTATRTALGDWWTSHSASEPWAAQYNAVLVGAMTPEFLTA